ncbi:uncharacterized protein AMSG_08665 [Thecamonas trahens ATCC 50062]|uniref:Uncharacterized protein n=1 Tax=Thecamonas trahens ATCC 50062 TaxID=461836 RepID=A0A0L0DK38_THETB|nr:hypothetical protein AMSG_08665 [Thecamonas trahens ATCC 50062]KNC52779.1 hypothetical protein AMSG_08665 [Thecamonas trahens ATCC 50062]|eukprot:XP_013755091.1 hypothetical protein AMSG_08665 [Thecamonas trahens ATCC 50062]
MRAYFANRRERVSVGVPEEEYDEGDESALSITPGPSSEPPVQKAPVVDPGPIPHALSMWGNFHISVSPLLRVYGHGKTTSGLECVTLGQLELDTENAELYGTIRLVFDPELGRPPILVNIRTPVPRNTILGEHLE